MPDAYNVLGACHLQHCITQRAASESAAPDPDPIHAVRVHIHTHTHTHAHTLVLCIQGNTHAGSAPARRAPWICCWLTSLTATQGPQRICCERTRTTTKQPRSVSRPLIAAVATSDDHVKAGDGAGNDISDEGGIYVIRESMLNLPL